MDQLIAWKGLAIGIWLVLLFFWERWRPMALDALRAEPPPEEGRWQWRRLARNAALWAGNSLLNPFIIIPLTLFASSLSPIDRTGVWEGWHAILLDVLILDFAIYWWHRANHEIPFLWRFHEIHHLDERLDTTSAVRFHFAEVLLSALLRSVIVFALGMPIESIIVFETLVLASALFHHANMKLDPRVERALSYVIVTPSIHWVHHHARREDTDSNYAAILSIWDKLFGSRSAFERTAEMKIGVQGLKDLPFRELLVRPFRREG